MGFYYPNPDQQKLRKGDARWDGDKHARRRIIDKTANAPFVAGRFQSGLYVTIFKMPVAAATTQSTIVSVVALSVRR